MAGNKFDKAEELKLILQDNSGTDYEANEIRLLMRQNKDMPLLNCRSEIIKRAEQSWSLLTTEERNEYAEKAFALPVSGLTLFISEYLRLSGENIADLPLDKVLKFIVKH